jgi:SAM-dependent methyltransferase
MVNNSFGDGPAYERFMARWSRAVGAIFLDWVAPPERARWLDVGCGTGVFTELVLDTCAPATIAAVDPSAAQIELARHKPVAQWVDFRVADAQQLPFADARFDVVASALVINFIPDRPRAIAEMRRVLRPGGVVAGYVWDFMGGRTPGSPINAGLRRIGVNPPGAEGREVSRLEALNALFSGSGLQDLATRTIEVSMTFPDFDDCWASLTPGYSPVGRLIAALPHAEREKLIKTVRAGLPAGPDGSITFSARANAIMGRVSD